MPRETNPKASFEVDFSSMDSQTVAGICHDINCEVGKLRGYARKYEKQIEDAVEAGKPPWQHLQPLPDRLRRQAEFLYQFSNWFWREWARRQP